MYYLNKKYLLLILSLTFLWSAVSFARQSQPKETVIREHTMYTLLKPGDIPAIFSPTFIPVSDADNFYHSDEPLIVVAEGDAVRGYSIWHLDHHEVVNDNINGQAIAITW